MRTPAKAPATALITAFVATLALSAATVPAHAFGPDMSTLTPTLTYPDDTSKPVTRDKGGIDE